MKQKRLAAALTAACCAASMLMAMPISPAQATAYVSNDFEVCYDGWYPSGEFTELTAETAMGFGGSRGMIVSERQSVSDGASSKKGFYLVGGVKYDYSVQVYSDTDETFHLSLRCTDMDSQAETVQELAVKQVKAGEWTTLSGAYTAPENSGDFCLTITTDSTNDFRFDNVKVSTKEKGFTVYAADKGLKDEFCDYFRVGNILNGGTVTKTAITDILLKDCNAIECENETKPDATLVKSGSTDTNIRVKADSFAAIADFCVQHSLGFRGHTLVWHSQTPPWFFRENFNDYGNYVSPSVMDQRMESYIKNMFKLFADQYPTLNLYAYDVCNEVVFDGTARQGGARPTSGDGKSDWVGVYGGNSFVEKAFTYARTYAPANCKLFYNDYNEFATDKQNCIIDTILKPLSQKGVLDGMGMQSHLDCSASNAWGDTNSYLAAMDKYLALGIEVQVTELDLSTSAGKFSWDQQATKYKTIFQHAMEANASGKYAKGVTLMQVWGPNDANSWVGTDRATGKSNDPLLYDKSNNAKPAYTAITSLVPQPWGDGSVYKGDTPIPDPEPDENGYWFHYTFENGTENFSGRSGGETITTTSSEHYAGSKALSVMDRTAAWHGAAVSLNARAFKAGEKYSFSGVVKNATGGAVETMHFTMQYTDAEGVTQYVKIASGDAPKGEWVQLSNPSFEIPAGATNCVIYFECDGETAGFYVDEVIGAVNGTVIDGPGEAKKLIIGDVDFDGVITAKDLTAAKRGLKTGLSGQPFLAADVDQSGELDATDIKLLKQYLTTEIDKFPVAERKVNFETLNNQFASLSLAKSWKADNENNPMTTQRFGADPGWLVYGDRLYIYTTNDAFEYQSNGNMQENTYNSGTINCVSTADMVNWTDHGAMPIADKNGRTTNGAAKWAYAAWAPDACCKTFNGKTKFYLFFANSGGGIGVVMADSPTGPWTDPIGGALLSHNSPNCGDVEWMFDPGVYYDDKTDECYLFFGGGRKNGIPAATPGTGRVVQLKLEENKVSLVGSPTKMDIPYLFEDSSVIKIGDTWYYSYCSNWDVGNQTVNGVNFGNADILYMKSTNPLEWNTSKLAGNVFKNTGSQRIDNGGNNHHSIIYFKNKYYVAYHSRQQAIRMTNANGYQFYNTKGELTNSKDGNYRSTQINEATFNNGSITCSGDMKGCSQIEYLNPYETVQAETMAQQAGIEISGVGDTVVTKIDKGDWIKVKGVDFSNGTRKFTVKASSNNGAVIKVCTGSASAANGFAYAEIPAGGQMKEITFDCLNTTGVNDIYFVFSGQVEFDSWSFS